MGDVVVRAASGGSFVGREAELRELGGALEDALAGRGRIVLLAGEPGIGKSRLADELGRRARDAGAEVLWGRAWEAGGAPAYWPWVQAARAYLRERPAETLRAQLGTGAAVLANILPELREVFADLPPPAAADHTEGERFRLFDATAALLRRAADVQPIVLVLDDLHAADTPSLLLLRFVADTLASSRVLVVAAYRDLDAAADGPLTATVSELTRSPVARFVSLRGLTRREVAAYIEAAAGARPRDDLVRTVYGETEGNPLFVSEVVRLLASEGGLERPGELRRFAIPANLREAIGKRLAGLSRGCRDVLVLASVLGREFAFDALERVAGLPDAAFGEALDEAMATRVLTDVPGALGRLRFAHALIRDVLYDEVTTPRRIGLHREVGEALESLYAADTHPHLAELAHHFFAAAPGGDAERAVRYARLAARRAAGLLAYEEAVRLYRLALQALDLARPADDAARCELVLALGEAQTRSGERADAKESFLEAVELTRRLGRPDLLARGALGYGGRFVWEADRGDPHLVPLLEEALAVVPADEPALRARLLARLAGGPLRDDVDRTRRDRLSAEAVELARELGDPALLAWVLDGRHAAVWWPERVDELLELAAALIVHATAAGDAERVFQGHHYRFVGLLQRGDLAGAHAEHRRQTRVAESLRQPAQLAYVSACRATLATLEARLDDAERHAHETFEVARHAYGSVGDLWLRVQLYAVRRAQGRLAESAQEIARAVDEFPTYGVFRCLHAHVECELGHERAARAAFRALVDEGFPIAPVEEWVYGLTLLADVAAALGERDAAEILYGLLLPHSDRAAVSPPDDCTGSVARSLGVLAAALGRHEDAARHFEAALAANAALRARYWLAQTQLDYARLLRLRDRSGDRETAARLLEDARAAAATLGLAGIARRIAEPHADRDDAVLRREGEYWTVGYEGETFRLRDSKGLRYLAALVAVPGREVHVLDLVAGAGEPAKVPRAGVREAADERLDASGFGDAGELLDAEARAAYARRIAELREELEEAERWRDPERVARARTELDFVAGELGSALGLGGRARRAPGAAERARQSVTKALRTAIARIGDESPALARRLEPTIRTGLFCTYDPDRRGPLEWRL